MTDGDARQVAQARLRRIGTVALRPVGRQSKRILVAALVGATFGVAAQLLIEDWGLATAINVAAALGAMGIAILPLRDRGLRAAIEVYGDHMQTERTEWQLYTGTRMPMGFKKTEAWLREQPDAPFGRPAALMLVGRFEEAEAELARRPPRNAAEAFEQALLREEGRVLQGLAPDIASLEAALPTLSPDQQRHRRECLALLAAYRAVDDGRDTQPILASGRDPAGLSNRRAHWFVLPSLALIAAIYPSLLAIPIRLLLG